MTTPNRQKSNAKKPRSYSRLHLVHCIRVQ